MDPYEVSQSHMQRNNTKLKSSWGHSRILLHTSSLETWEVALLHRGLGGSLWGDVRPQKGVYERTMLV